MNPTEDCPTRVAPGAPIVSVIIPTIRRPDLLLRAIHSVLSQTLQDLEVIVVVDGPDPATIATLQNVTDARVRVISNPHALGAGRSRNAGVAQASGRYVAFLDDDDEFLPEKLEKQVRVAENHGNVLVTCISRVITPFGADVWPTTIFDNTQPFDDYLFVKTGPFVGASFIQTSSQLLPRSLYLRAPFPEASPHDDWEFVIRLTRQMQARVETVPEILVVHYMNGQAGSLSNKDAWKASLTWLVGMRAIMTRRAYSGFCLGVVGPRAAKERDYKAIVPLLWQAFRHGAPSGLLLLFFVAVWLIPEESRKRLRASLRRGRNGEAHRREPEPSVNIR